MDINLVNPKKEFGLFITQVLLLIYGGFGIIRILNILTSNLSNITDPLLHTCINTINTHRPPNIMGCNKAHRKTHDCNINRPQHIRNQPTSGTQNTKPSRNNNPKHNSRRHRIHYTLPMHDQMDSDTNQTQKHPNRIRLSNNGIKNYFTVLLYLSAYSPTTGSIYLSPR